MPHRLSLEKYSGPSSRYSCPQCGNMEFVRYVDIISGKHVGIDIGRCNRESKCGYHRPPREAGFSYKPFTNSNPIGQEKKCITFISGALLKSTIGSYQQIY